MLTPAELQATADIARPVDYWPCGKSSELIENADKTSKNIGPRNDFAKGYKMLFGIFSL